MSATPNPPGANPSRRAAAMEIVRIHTALAAGTHLIPTPMIGSFAVSALQLRMLSELAILYGDNFDQHRNRALAAAIGTSVASELVRRSAFAAPVGQWFAAAPLVGTTLRFFAWPTAMAATTYFLGKAYVEHYENGGQFENFKLSGLLHSPVIHPTH